MELWQRWGSSVIGSRWVSRLDAQLYVLRPSHNGGTLSKNHGGQQARPGKRAEYATRWSYHVWQARPRLPSSTTKDLSSRDRPLWDPRGQRRNGLPRHGAQSSRPSCDILPGGGPSGCSACASDNEEGVLQQAHRPVAHIHSDGDPPLTPGMRLGPRTRHHPQAAPDHTQTHQEGPLRSRCEWLPSSSEPITLSEPVPPVPCRFPLRLPPPYRAVSQGNWLVNSVKPPSPCTAP